MKSIIIYTSIIGALLCGIGIGTAIRQSAIAVCIYSLGMGGFWLLVCKAAKREF